jgi:hypothetical protein
MYFAQTCTKYQCKLSYKDSIAILNTLQPAGIRTQDFHQGYFSTLVFQNILYLEQGSEDLNRKPDFSGAGS